ncbi:MmcB family DNA repair protein [Acinetobacter sp. UBA6720]|uniref:MmcB family DNA repair protein n=1 Tax=Acinetobacter sp. UBA6720 TaxID=1945953 RepID=UPI0025BCF1B1|nr:MmcB family DNA repair protein [Acinetobacter sp. UBA6720]
MKEAIKWGHDQLAEDLAKHLGQNSDRIIWTDMQLGPSGSPRPDVYSIPKSYTNFKPLAYECKVSVSDFRSDITKGKWQSYLRFASGVIFAVPKGLISKDDVPKGCGLIVRSENGWRMVKGPTLQPIANDLPKDFWIKLVIDGVDRSKGHTRINSINEYKIRQKIAKKYGEDLAMALARKDQAQQALDYRTEELRKAIGDLDVVKHAARQRELISVEKLEVETMFNDLCEFLNLPTSSTSWEVRSELKRLKQSLSKDGQISQTQSAVANAIRSLESQLKELKTLSQRVGSEVVA